ncbi:MAG: DUF4445 domain-containing protein [Clostridia bacterium]|nr:DUF4445 domain-containing protein [Clostridia bacterium]
MARIMIDGTEYAAYPGELLSDALRRAGFSVPMPCGGRGTCGKCLVTVNGKRERACGYIIESDIRVVLPGRETIVSDLGANTGAEGTGNLALALDIGTTTLAAALISLDGGRIVRAATGVNPQRAFGADVMNRIGYCREHGPAPLRDAVTGAVKELLTQLDVPPVGTMFTAGNTTMLHLFFGVDCSAMGTAPYTPVFLESKTVPGEDLGFSGIGNIVSLPSAAAFVGADLTAGLNSVGLPPEGKYRLLIDLGTNAEVVLFSREGALCTAAAAGPCFEGANISCGMSASPGAICAYSARGYATVGGAPAVGVCGTGLVDAVAALLEDGTIDGSGYMECESFELAPGVTLTQADVRQYQLAKSAVLSAVQTLLQMRGVSYEEIDALYIAGGFSAKIDIENAVKTGLLPGELKEKCAAVGNSSLLGTAKYAAEKNDLSVFLDHMTYVDLAADPVFSELFVENMLFGGDEA